MDFPVERGLKTGATLNENYYLKQMHCSFEIWHLYEENKILLAFSTERIQMFFK